MSEAAYTEHRYTKPQEHTLYPKPAQVFECSECGTSGYYYPEGSGRLAGPEVWAYRQCIRTGRVHTGNQHVWVYEDTVQTQGTGDYAFPGGVPAKYDDLP